MTIRIIKEPDVHVTEADLARYRKEHDEFHRHYGAPIPFETYVRQREEARKQLPNQNPAHW